MKKLFLILMIFLGTFSSRAERVALINDPSQIIVNNKKDGDNVNNLIDGDVTTSVHSKEGELGSYCYIQVNLESPLSLTDQEDLIVYLQRCNHNENEAHPTTFKVEGSLDGQSWEGWDTNIESCHVYFVYRGPKTKEYSTRIHTSKPFKYLRFTVMANSGRKHDLAGHRYMGLSEFQIYKLGRNDNYSDNLIDRFHLTTDYYKKLTNFEFKNTMGVLDERNRVGGRPANLNSWTDWSGWSAEGKWTKDTEALQKAGIEMPEYTMLTSENDGAHGYKPDVGQQRQPTHVTEHILYAIPGDAIALYPFYRFTKTTNYNVNFAHWYDYQSGGHVNTTDATTKKEVSMLDFLIDPTEIHKNDNYGYFAGKEIGKERPEITTVDQYIEAVRESNKSAGKAICIKLGANLDFSGYTDVPQICSAGGDGDFYRGTFDGCGHTIKNLKMTGGENVGLIAKAGNGAVIRNLIIDKSCEFSGTNNVAALVGREVYANGVTIDRVQCYAKVTATASDGAAAALIGSKGDIYDSTTKISNCFIEGTVTANKAAAVIIWKKDFSKLTISNTVSVTNVNSNSTLGEPFTANIDDTTINSVTINNCYSGNTLPKDLNDASFIANLGTDNWESNSDKNHAVPKIFIPAEPPHEVSDSYYGKVATFFCPRSPYAEEGKLQNLPFRDGQKEFIIAADFSQSFDHTRNLVNNIIIEPIIQFRHIFRIRDGKDFAEEFSGSPDNNKEYVRKNLRRVSARANVPFQIRLDSPVPQGGTTRSKYYYKISNTDYRRVCSMNVEVTHVETNKTQRVVMKNGIMYDGNSKVISTNGDSDQFYYGEEFDGEGTRTIDGTDYNFCGGGGKYYRMLKCNKPKEGHYLVKVTGNDINGNPIKIFNSNEALVVMEMELTVLPETGACMVSDEGLYATDTKYKFAQEEELEKAYGEPKQRLTFDEYVALENLSNQTDYLEQAGTGKYRLKWPTPWDNVTYSFDYNAGRNYNMYCIASHSERTWMNSSQLYDRLYYKSKRLDPSSNKHGYFYYVNASDDPGVMARLRLEDLCMGSTIHVSAWLAEFSNGNEKANVSFNFIAVLNEANGKERIPLHSFVSGYVPNSGEWFNVYYSFIPNYTEAGITPDMVDHYELELDNNCKNSESADYAVDNIRLYIASPRIYAAQNEPICDNKPGTDLSVRIESPFDVLLQVVGETEASESENKSKTLYYTFIDKKKFDKKYDEYDKAGNSDAGRKAYDDAVLRYNYANGGEGEQTFGKISFNLHFESNPEYVDGSTALSTMAFRKTDADDGTRLIVFNTIPNDANLQIGKEYYVSIYLSPDENDDKISPTWTEFDLLNPCSRVNTFSVKPRSTIKIDGELRNDAGDIICCENQTPVVQVNLWGKKEGGEMKPIINNARLDWFNGSYDEFKEAKSESGVLLSDVLTIFRSLYPDREDCDVEPTGELTKAMITYLKNLTEEIPENGVRPLLTLSKTSYVFSSLKPDDQGSGYCYVVAIPIDNGDMDGYLICSQPTEVRIRVQHHSPELYNGIAKIDYPDYMVDVPLRIGLKQLKAVSASESEVASHDLSLQVPFRTVKPVTSGVSELRRVQVQNRSYIYLVETNDPGYKDLGTVDGEGNETGALMAVGEIKSFSANVNYDNKDWESNCFGAVFYDRFKFKEGYYYRMRFMFEEKPVSNSDNEESEVCSGHDVFTIKVVPEYLRWIGNSEIGKNWNNDDNWERVESADLFLSESRKTELSDYVVDGSNEIRRSYAPLNFTKVIIPSTDVFPHLAGYADNLIVDFSTYYPNLKSEYPYKKNGVYWINEPTIDEADPATKDIQYDMVANQENVYTMRCRPWYANTCEQIHFCPKSEIMGQQYLIYQKAWVDIATKPGRWYTLSTPLQSVYAGDLYLPFGNGRQETELFTEMTFNTKVNNRFKPAVYQRGWNKSNTKRYEIPELNSSNGTNRNVAIKANWSSVYNDVEEAYGGGTGFSIKTDASMIDGANEVLFRLPKSDMFFDYYSENGSTVGNNTTITRNATQQFKLNYINPVLSNNRITARSAGDNKYFLVGNPFMAHLDMKKFLKSNQNKIAPKYWILTEGTQQVAVFDETSEVFVGSVEGAVAPLQGFFVEAMDGAADKDGDDVVLYLNYDASMACTAPFTESSLRAQTRSGSAGDNNAVVISALRDNRTVSQAFIHLSQDADCGYNEKEDALLFDNSQLDIPAEVYTVAGNAALSVNSTDDADGTEIGLLAEDAKETVLVFEGVDPLGDLALYDASTGYRTALYEGMEYPVTGPVAGRLYITSGKATANEEISSMRVSVYNRTVRIEAGSGNTLSAKAYTMQGFMIKDMKGESPILEFKLNRGIYILEATDGIETTKRKILIL